MSYLACRERRGSSCGKKILYDANQDYSAQAQSFGSEWIGLQLGSIDTWNSVPAARIGTACGAGIRARQQQGSGPQYLVI